MRPSPHPQNQRLIYLSFACLCFLLLFFLLQHFIFSNDVTSIQQNINHFFTNIQSNILNFIVIFITYTGNFLPVFILAIAICYGLYRFNLKLEAIFFSINLLSLIIVNTLVKSYFQRERPNFNQLIDIDGFSFPSGHAMINLGIALFSAFLVYKLIEYKLPARIISAIIIVYALLIGISRIYVGVHFLSDVLGGWLLGGFVSCLVLVIYEAISIRQANKDVYFIPTHRS
ncbi:MAG: phosphatase PAP2 family protein [Turicibacter sp.]